MCTAGTSTPPPNATPTTTRYRARPRRRRTTGCWSAARRVNTVTVSVNRCCCVFCTEACRSKGSHVRTKKKRLQNKCHFEKDRFIIVLFVKCIRVEPGSEGNLQCTPVTEKPSEESAPGESGPAVGSNPAPRPTEPPTVDRNPGDKYCSSEWRSVGYEGECGRPCPR